MTMRECPRYLGCGAPICPLDPDWRKRSHLPGERVCIWLTELAKPGGMAIVSARVGDDVAQDLVEISPAIVETWGAIRNVVERAATTGSKLEAEMRRGQRLGERSRRATAGESTGEPGDGGSPSGSAPGTPGAGG